MTTCFYIFYKIISQEMVPFHAAIYINVRKIFCLKWEKIKRNKVVRKKVNEKGKTTKEKNRKMYFGIQVKNS